MTQITDAQEQSQSSTRIQAVIETGLIVAGLLAIMLLLPHSIYSDAQLRFDAITELIRHRKLIDIPYSLIGPIFSIPFWIFGKFYKSPAEWIEQYNLFVFACGLLVTYLMLKDRMDRSLLRKFFLLLTVGSMFPMHLTTYYGEVFTAVCVGFGILITLVRPSVVGGWIAVVLGVANTPASLVGLGCLVLKQLWDSKRWRYALILVAAAALICTEAWIRRGNPFASGYEGDHGFPSVMPYAGLPDFSYPFFFGLLSILLSFGKGLVFFTPGFLLPIKNTLLRVQQTQKLELYRVYILWMCFLAGLILIYARWWAWYGGLFWGPRFFLFASIPASFALAVRLHYRNAPYLVNLLTLLIFGLSMWVGLNGAIFSNTVVVISTCTQDAYRLEALCHYTLEYSVLWRPFVVRLHLNQQQIIYTFYTLLAGLYLVWPLLMVCIRQSIELVVHIGKDRMNFLAWRF